MLFRVDTRDVIQETIKGEVIIVHLVTGSYYSLLRSGAAIWAAVEGGLEEDAMIDQFVGPDTSEREAVASAVRRFLGELQNEELIVPVEPGSPVTVASEFQTLEVQQPFAEPVLEKYSDMQDLLRLDPIHEVDASGWPSAKKEAG